MTVGDKIKKIRTFRGMTQKELGLAIGFEEKGADNRIAQYETNYRVPKRELLDKMAEALRVDRQNFYTIAPGSAEDFMRTFFWLDEDSPGAIRLFQLVRNPGRAGAADDTAVRYNDSDDWPAHPPVGMYFQYGLVDEFMREWLFRQQELHAGEITREEYFEWKLNWPHTCDDGLESEYYIPWRKDTNSINPVSRAVWTGKKACIHAGFRRFERHSHSIIPPLITEQHKLYLARLTKFFQHCFKLNSRPKAPFIFCRFRFTLRRYILEFIGGFNPTL